MFFQSISTMSKDEKSLLLFLETRAVDHAGMVNLQHMNVEDCALAKAWDEAGFIEFKRIPFKCLKQHKRSGSTSWVILSDAAWDLVAKLRRERADRLGDQAREYREMKKAMRGETSTEAAHG